MKRLDEPQLLYVLLKIQPTQGVSVRSDAPLNLCLVVDRSKSMQGVRLQHVKSAARRIIDASRPEDIISIVVFSDEAEVIVPAQHPRDPQGIKALISTIRADGATEMLAGLKAGISQIERNLDPRYVNHLILITDGRTYGDEDKCLELASAAHMNGISISGIGIGEDWNDRFLDELASRTGGSSAYISTSEAISRFLNERVRTLAAAYAERSRLVVAPSIQAELVSLTRMSPNPMPLPADEQPVPLGTVDGAGTTSVVLQFQIHTKEAELGEFFVGRVEVSGQVLGTGRMVDQAVLDLAIQVTDRQIEEDPPPGLLDALNRLMLYRLQERAREAVEKGDPEEATRRLEYLATRLFESGEEDLGQAALLEARRVAHTQRLSDEGAKRLKYGTRALLTLFEDEK